MTSLSVLSCPIHSTVSCFLCGLICDPFEIVRSLLCPMYPQDMEGLRGKTWYSDGVHGAGDTGYRGMGELAIQAIITAQEGLVARPLNSEDVAVAEAELPPPLVRHNWPSLADRCFVGTYLVQVRAWGASYVSVCV